MKKCLILVATIFLVVTIFGKTGGSEMVPIDSSRWKIIDVNGKVEEHLGRQSLFLRSGLALLEDVGLEDGVIEVDIAASNRVSFMGMVFRLQNEGDYEVVYFRGHKSDRPDAVQYTPSFNGSSGWQLYSGSGFTAATHIRHDTWVHARIEISGLSARIYLDDMEEPALSVDDLKRGVGGGQLGLWGLAGGGYFSNFSYERTEAAKIPKRSPVEFNPGIITKWELSEAFDSGIRDIDAMPSVADMEGMTWQVVGVERPGMVVINRHRKAAEVVPFFREPKDRTGAREGRRVVFARAAIYSDRAQIKRMSFGYSDEASVFLNSRPVFTGKSAYLYRDPAFAGIMDVENDAVYLDLKQGRNEITLAVADYFGGWGFICRIDDMRGIKVE